MENQHRKISGYRELSQDEINLMNEIKAKGQELGDLLDKVQAHLSRQVAAALNSELSDDEGARIDAAQPQRWAAMARTDFQIGVMKLVRAVAQPTDGL
jgi:hypothetical protein